MCIRDRVQVGQVVCLIDMDAKKPEGSAPAAEAPKAENAEAPKAEQKVVEKPAIVQEAKKEEAKPTSYATGTPSPAAKKILDEKGVDSSQVSVTGKEGRICLLYTSRCV